MKVDVKINLKQAIRQAKNKSSWRVYIVNCSYHKPTRKGV